MEYFTAESAILIADIAKKTNREGQNHFLKKI